MTLTKWWTQLLIVSVLLSGLVGSGAAAEDSVSTDSLFQRVEDFGEERLLDIWVTRGEQLLSLLESMPIDSWGRPDPSGLNDFERPWLAAALQLRSLITSGVSRQRMRGGPTSTIPEELVYQAHAEVAEEHRPDYVNFWGYLDLVVAKADAMFRRVMYQRANGRENARRAVPTGDWIAGTEEALSLPTTRPTPEDQVIEAELERILIEFWEEDLTPFERRILEVRYFSAVDDLPWRDVLQRLKDFPEEENRPESAEALARRGSRLRAQLRCLLFSRSEPVTLDYALALVESDSALSKARGKRFRPRTGRRTRRGRHYYQQERVSPARQRIRELQRAELRYERDPTTMSTEGRIELLIRSPETLLSSDWVDWFRGDPAMLRYREPLARILAEYLYEELGLERERCRL